jgi:cytidylate kinase
VIVAISGNTGSGKDTAADLLAQRLGIRAVKGTLKTYAKEKGLDILEFERTVAANSDEWDKKLDEWQRSEVAKGDCVLVSRLAAFNAPGADLKVWLHAPEKVRAQRIAIRDSISERKSLAYVRSRDRTFRKRARKLYKFDPWDQRHYDLAINTAKWAPEEIVRIMLTALKR